MKIFRIFHNNISSEQALYNNGVSIATIPDTALLIQKRPFFIPDFTQDCQVQLCACIHINRLGRSIHERFANRYYNNITLAVHFTAKDLLNKLQAAHQPWDIAIGFDNAVAISAVSCKEADEAAELKATATICINKDEYTSAFFVDEISRSANALIAQISQTYTLRQGDLILLPLQTEEIQVQIDDRVSLKYNGLEHLSFNIK